jgi:glutamate--cysteine ligase
MNLLKTYGTKFLQQNETPESNWRIGFEVERFAVDSKTGIQLPYSGNTNSIKGIIEVLISKYSFKPVFTDNQLMGAKNHYADISIEPGSQFEIAFNPQNIFTKLIENFITLNDILCEIAENMGFSWLSTGHNPHSTPDEIIVIPKKRYHIMEKYLSATGNRALHMMKCTSSIQTSVDYKSEEHFRKIMKLCHLMAPVMYGLFANSPFRADNKSYMNFRSLIWRNVDNRRCGRIPSALQGELGYKEYMEYICNTPLMLAYDESMQLTYPDKMTNSEYFSVSTLPPDEKFDLLLSSVFTLSRSKNYIEYRVFDALPLELTMLPPLLSSILFYSDKALDSLEKLFTGFTEDDLLKGIEESALYGINGKYGQCSIYTLAEKVLSIAKSSLTDVKGLMIAPETAARLFSKADKLVEERRSPAESSVLKNAKTSFPGIMVDDNIITDSIPLKELLS